MPRSLNRVDFHPFTDLRLHGSTPARVQPVAGEWGPADVPTTRAKKRLRILVPIAFVVVAVIMAAWAYYVFTLLRGAIGF